MPKKQQPISRSGPDAVSASRWLKDVEAMAVAIGLELYARSRRNLRDKQLEAVKALFHPETGAPDFPKKEKFKGGSGWPRAAVLAWCSANMELHKNQRTFQLVEGKPVRGDARPTDELQDQKNPAGDGDLFLTMTPEQLRIEHIKTLKRIYVEGTRKLDSTEKSLIGVAVTEADKDNEEITGGHEGIAIAIRREFNVECHVVYVSDWLKGRRYPCPEAPKMPHAERSGRYNKKKIFDWYRKYVLKDETPESELKLPHAVDNRSRKEKADADLAEMAADTERKKSSGLYTLTETAVRTGTAIGTVAKNTNRDALEKKLPRRFASGLDQIITDPAMLDKVLLKLRADAVETFTEWQKQTAQQLAEMLDKLKPVLAEAT